MTVSKKKKKKKEIKGKATFPAFIILTDNTLKVDQLSTFQALSYLLSHLVPTRAWWVR